MDTRELLPPGKLLPGDRTCSSCCDILANPASLSAVMSSDSSFTYTRRYEDLEESADAGCILCLHLIDRQIQLGPSLEETTNLSSDECGPTCHCIQPAYGHHLSFTIQKFIDKGDDDGNIRTLLIQGVRKQKGPTLSYWELCFVVEASKDSPAAQEIPIRPVEPDVGSERCLEMARTRLKTCIETHLSCAGISSALLPTRVIDVVGHGDQPRLYQSDSGQEGTYIALSYCWGGSQPSQTTKERLSAYCKSIPMNEQAKTIQDAIIITRQLGIRFLWVDSLCIVQDDDDDKIKEIVKMRSVYENALLTISAASAKSSAQGFLYPRNELIHPITSLGYRHRDFYTSFTMQYRCRDGTVAPVMITGDSRATPISDPIDDRAWTLQESMLSSRMLVYSSFQLVWRCRTEFDNFGGSYSWHNFNEKLPLLDIGDPAPIHKLEKRSIGPAAISMICFGDDSFAGPKSIAGQSQGVHQVSVSQNLKNWMGIVRLYSRRRMSNAADKFPAISGIAAKFAMAMGDEYCAGLWRNEILPSLSWHRWIYAKSTRTFIFSVDEQDDERKWRAPSWSWASVNGFVTYLRDDRYWSGMDSGFAHVHDVFVDHYPGHSPFGMVFWGEITIEGWLRRVEIEPIPAVDWSNPTGSRRDSLKFADVFLLAHTGEQDKGLEDSSSSSQRRCATSILDESIDSVPYQWSHPDGLQELYAMTLFCSQKWASGGKRLRTHGLLLVKWPVGNYTRVGWFDSLALSREEFSTWFGKKNRRIIQLV